MSTRDGRIALLAIDEMCWHDFQLQLEEGWIDWQQPKFLGDDPDWEDFLRGQEPRYPNIRTEIAEVVRSLDAVWVLKTNSSFEYIKMAVFEPGCQRTS
jgi:hypothetical protein